MMYCRQYPALWLNCCVQQHENEFKRRISNTSFCTSCKTFDCSIPNCPLYSTTPNLWRLAKRSDTRPPHPHSETKADNCSGPKAALVQGQMIINKFRIDKSRRLAELG